jgi:predicted enzyme related to lactoylglutathione lyase
LRAAGRTRALDRRRAYERGATNMADKTQTNTINYEQGDLCHLEIPVKDKERAKAFYGEIFGWKFNEMPEMNYTMFETPGKVVNGGFFTPSEQQPDKVVNYLQVNSIEEATKKITRFGGKTLSPQIEVPGHGSFMHVLDSEGNHIAIWQASKK